MKHVRSPLLFLPVLTLALVLGLPAGASAGEARPEAPGLDVIELLPIQEVEWGMLLHEHPTLVERIMFLGKRIERVYGHLQERADKTDAGSRKLIQQIERLKADLDPHLVRVLELARSFGVDQDVLSVLDDAPQGALRIERHALRVVLHLADLDTRQRDIHTRLVPAVEGALLALHGSLGGEDDTALELRMKAVQKRFWRVVDATLTREQRIALRRRLPTKVAKYADLFGHLYTLPDLTPEQGARLKSLFVRLEAEAAPDQAEVARAERQLLEEGLESSERRRLEAAKREAERRNLDLLLAAWREGVEILNADQMAEMKSILPLLTAKDRPGDLKEELAAFDLQPDQQPALLELHRRYGPVKGRLQQRLAVLALEAQRYGPDAPQQEAMQMRQAGAYAEALVEARKAAHELFTDVFTTDQIVRWVVDAR